MPAPLRLRTVTFDFSRTYVAGIVNVTPDSFSDGGRYLSPDAARTQGAELVEAGADLLDIGGESTRPGAESVTARAELERVLPVIEGLAELGVPLSIDTTKAEVAAAALDAGAELVNDISGGRFDPAIIDVAASRGAVYVLGHVRGERLDEVHAAEPAGADEVAFELAARVAALPAALRHRTIVDPGLGFGKGTPENLELIARAGQLARVTRCPVMVGPSRKRFLGEITGAPASQRDPATVGACLAAVAAGAHFLRVHEVAGLVPALRVFEATGVRRVGVLRPSEE